MIGIKVGNLNHLVEFIERFFECIEKLMDHLDHTAKT